MHFKIWREARPILESSSSSSERATSLQEGQGKDLARTEMSTILKPCRISPSLSELSSEESSDSGFSFCTEAGKDLKLLDFTPLAECSSSPLTSFLFSIDSFYTEAASVEELLFFVYWLPVILFFSFSTVNFRWSHVSLRIFLELNCKHWLSPLPRFMPKTTSCNCTTKCFRFSLNLLPVFPSLEDAQMIGAEKLPFLHQNNM